jgi:hypothetical protein
MRGVVKCVAALRMIAVSVLKRLGRHATGWKRTFAALVFHTRIKNIKSQLRQRMYMGKVKSERVIVKYPLPDTRLSESQTEVALDFSLDIFVSSRGLFYATLPDNIAGLFVEAGLGLQTSPRQRKVGYFEASTLEELLRSVREKSQLYATAQICDRRLIIRYQIATQCTYVRGGNGYHYPNGKFDPNWQENGGFTYGTSDSHVHESTYGFQLWTEVSLRTTLSFRNGSQKTFFTPVFHHEDDSKPNLKWLSGIIRNKKPDGVIKEIEYTEDTAAFFIAMYKHIFQINDAVAHFTNPDTIRSFVNSKEPLMLSSRVDHRIS